MILARKSLVLATVHARTNLVLAGQNGPGRNQSGSGGGAFSFWPEWIWLWRPCISIVHTRTSLVSLVLAEVTARTRLASLASLVPAEVTARTRLVLANLAVKKHHPGRGGVTIAYSQIGQIQFCSGRNPARTKLSLAKLGSATLSSVVTSAQGATAGAARAQIVTLAAKLAMVSWY